MPTSLKYTIIPPTNVLEASTSVGSDDVALARIIVQARNATAETINVTQIGFTVAELAPAGLTDVQKAAALEKALTRRASNITAITAEPGAWEFGRVDSEAPAANGLRSVAFLAKPSPPAESVALAAGAKFTFILDTIEVVEMAGETALGIEDKVRRVDGTIVTGSDDTNTIRKIAPDLRIDSFTADQLLLETEGNVVLSWNTTAAEVIALEGVSAAEVTAFKTKFPSSPVETGPVAKSNSEEVHDDSFTVRPARTTTYTLRASSGTANAEVIRQLTVTVKHPTSASAGQMAVGDAAFSATLAGAGNLKVQGVASAARLAIGDATFVGGQPAAGDVKVQGVVSATRIEGQGAVPAGAIVMWSGNVADIPKDWTLCDGVSRTLQDGTTQTPPDLRGRFIVGIGTDSGRTYSLLERDGEREVKLTTTTIPLHSHSASVSLNKTLEFCQHDDSAPNSSADFFVSAVAPIAGTKTILRKTETIAVSLSATGDVGENGAHNNLPPFVALAYIMKLRLPVA